MGAFWPDERLFSRRCSETWHIQVAGDFRRAQAVRRARESALPANALWQLLLARFWRCWDSSPPARDPRSTRRHHRDAATLDGDERRPNGAARFCGRLAPTLLGQDRFDRGRVEFALEVAVELYVKPVSAPRQSTDGQAFLDGSEQSGARRRRVAEMSSCRPQADEGLVVHE